MVLWQYQILADPVLPDDLRPEAPQLDKFDQPTNEPQRERPFSFAAVFAAGLLFVGEPSDFAAAEVVTLDKWFAQADEPVRETPRQIEAVQGSLFFDPFPIQGLAGDLGRVDWWTQDLEPVFLPPPRQDGGAAFDIEPNILTAYDPATLSWYWQTGEPLRLQALLDPANHPWEAIDATALALAEDITLDKWFVALSEPTLPAPSVAEFPAHVGSLEPIVISETGPGPEQMEWFVPPSEPTLPPERSVELLGGGLGTLRSTTVVHAKYGHRAIVRPNQ